MANVRGWQLIIIVLLALLLFGGYKKLPDAARGIGRSLRIFKAETKGLVEDEPEQAVAGSTEPAAVTETQETAKTASAPKLEVDG
ncbi:MAG: twin-arginine translocase TatA/TatE family subunit [Candidatus Nanopelagicales bacterium]|nr:twin-arginine translocase TatA/TatE family subunit [Candidatus Nanopelagicales bacterium]